MKKTKTNNFPCPVHEARLRNLETAVTENREAIKAMQKSYNEIGKDIRKLHVTFVTEIGRLEKSFTQSILEIVKRRK